MFRGVSDMFYKTASGDPRYVPESLMEYCWRTMGLQHVSRAFQGCFIGFQGVPGAFQSFQGVLSALNEASVDFRGFHVRSIVLQGFSEAF